MANLPIYLDHAAATPLDPAVLNAMQSYFSDNFYNPSANYGAAQSVRQALDTARTEAAYWLGAKPSEIIFTAGGSEANNLAIHGVMRQFPEANIVISGVEHESVLEPAQEYDVRQIAVGLDGRIDLTDLTSKIDGNTVFVSIMYANNEIGSIQPIRQAAQIIKQKRSQRKVGDKPLYFHSDAAQAANYLDLHVSRLGVDMMTLNGGKIYGPKQSGLLYIKAGIKLLPLVQGGGQERGLRSGTENVAASIGLARALKLVQSDRQAESERLSGLQAQFFDLLEKVIKDIVINGSRKFRLPNNVHVTLPGRDNERLLFQLDEQNIMAAAGSACNASNETPSHVLRALGLSDETARSSLRFTMGRSTTIDMVKQVVKTLAKL